MDTIYRELTTVSIALRLTHEKLVNEYTITILKGP